MLRPHNGQRVVCKRVIQCYPHFIVPMSSLGTVVSSNHPHGNIMVKMDAKIAGCEAWDNCVVCYGLTDFFDNFEDLLVCQLEAALIIVHESGNAKKYAEWVQNTCAALAN